MENPLVEATPQLRRLFHIGNICAQWAALEYAVAQIIWVQLGTGEEVGKIVTGGLDMLPRINMAINLSRALDTPPALVQKLKETRKALQDGLSDERNRAVHGVQFIKDENDELLVEVHRGKGDRTRKPLTEEELNRLGEKIFQLTTELKLEILSSADGLRSALRNMAQKILDTVSDELNSPKSGSNSQNS